MTTEQPRTNRSWLIVVLVFVVFWIAYLALFLPDNRSSSLERLRTNQPAAYNWILEDLKAQAVDFSRFQGKTVFLNIWATWCPPCVGEMPSIARLASESRLKEKNVEFICVSVDESLDTVRDFVASKNWPMTILHSRSLPSPYQTEGIPATFILSPGGRIVAAEVGAGEWDRPEVVSFLEETALEKNNAVPNPGQPG